MRLQVSAAKSSVLAEQTVPQHLSVTCGNWTQVHAFQPACRGSLSVLWSIVVLLVCTQNAAELTYTFASIAVCAQLLEAT